jgi:site-specific DNA-methyltransferase (adenine-specific)
MEIKNIHGDCLTELSKLSDNSIDIAITSPPYKDSDGYDVVFLDKVFEEVHRVLKPNSLFFLNFGHLAEDKFRPFSVCLSAIVAGFHLNETIIWVKNHYRPIQGNKRLNNLSEFVFLLYKGKMPKLDRLAIGVPYADKSNAKRFAGGRDLKCRGNVWYIDYETVTSKEEKLHNDRFPIELPETCIKLSGLKSGVVLDAFSGSASTAIAAMRNGLSFIGFEKNELNWKIGCQRIQNERNLRNNRQSKSTNPNLG